MLKSGSSGDEVKMLQRLLMVRGLNPGPVDGIFGPKTEAAVKAYQEKAGLDADGIAGPKTMEAIKDVGAADAPAEETSGDEGSGRAL
jgi:peptidoglycan hydrolase-like protein with peptidoglycan-binding domain